MITCRNAVSDVYLSCIFPDYTDNEPDTDLSGETDEPVGPTLNYTTTRKPYTTLKYADVTLEFDEENDGNLKPGVSKGIFKAYTNISVNVCALINF